MPSKADLALRREQQRMQDCQRIWEIHHQGMALRRERRQIIKRLGYDPMRKA